MNTLFKDSQWRMRVFLFFVVDVFSILCAEFLALLVRYEFVFRDIEKKYLEVIYNYASVNIVITVLIFYIFRLYTSLWKYASINELVNIICGVVVSSVINEAVMEVLRYDLPRSYVFLYVIFMLVFVSISRFSYRFVRYVRNEYYSKGKKRTTNVMVIGAGDAGAAIVKEILLSKRTIRKVCCFIDDNKTKQGKYIQGIYVAGGCKDIKKAAEHYKIDQIIIAVPSASKKTIKEIVEKCQDTGCEIRILPGIYQLINGEVSVSKLRPVEIEDLLGRESIKVNNDEIFAFIRDKTILVTGGGGSIGSELCRQIAKSNPKKLVIFDIYENNAYSIQLELKRKYPELDLEVLIGSVRNTNRINWVMQKYKPDVVFHAAAHKHVPLMEDSPCESIKNNVLGTYKTAVAASAAGVKKFVLISTDKAVNPTNIMGASKRLCEMVVQMMNRQADTDFVAVRFGNVLGSNGSVIPLFKKQIEAGGPVTVTDKNIIRYFMTIPEAVSLVLQASYYAKGGEIFILDMGEPVRIDDMARNLIRLSGYKPDVDIKIEYTGLRPGEKLYEELLMSEEGMQDTENKLIHIGKPIEMDDEWFKEKLKELDAASKNEQEDMKQIVSQIIPTYHYKEEK